MKPLNYNRAQIYLLFTRRPMAVLTTQELEYYSSDNDELMGFIAKDRIDGDYQACLLDRTPGQAYEAADFKIGLSSIAEVREALAKLMDDYERPSEFQRNKPVYEDFFEIKAKEKELSEDFLRLCNERFHTPAKELITELSYQFDDKDKNFINQFQSQNGFDARMWELYLRSYLREENFEFDNTHQVPDFIVNKFDKKVAIEAVVIPREEGDAFEEGFQMLELEKLVYLQNEMPLKFGKELFDKNRHKGKPYWDMEHVKGLPFVIAVADFHKAQSMIWSHPAISSILYGFSQKLTVDNEGRPHVQNINGLTFHKSNATEVTPLFLSKDFEHVSAVMTSSSGTLAKFDRMGKQAGMGDKAIITFQTKLLYNHADNATDAIPETVFVTEHSRETWSDGLNIYHNPNALVKLDPSLFPHAAHHYFRDGQLYSDVPPHFCMCSMTFNNIGV